LRETTGQDFTAKDFRTWAGTVLAVQALSGAKECSSKTGVKKNILAAIKVVAEQLRNTPAICRKSYIHPVVLEAYGDGYLAQRCKLHLATSSRSSRLESVLLRLLRRRKPAPNATKPSPQHLLSSHKGVAKRSGKRSKDSADRLDGRTAA
jgi:DNA topoisomerase-1